MTLTIGILLLRQVLHAGGVGKGAISEGDFADVIGCYPHHIGDLYHEAGGGAISIGGGIMRILPVMGTALINSHRLHSDGKTPSGPLLLVESCQQSRLPVGVRTKECNGLAVIDWVHSSYPALDETAQKAGFPLRDSGEMVTSLSHYLDGNNLSDD